LVKNNPVLNPMDLAMKLQNYPVFGLENFLIFRVKLNFCMQEEKISLSAALNAPHVL
jgi:hypothetical protein